MGCGASSEPAAQPPHANTHNPATNAQKSSDGASGGAAKPVAGGPSGGPVALPPQKAADKTATDKPVSKPTDPPAEQPSAKPQPAPAPAKPAPAPAPTPSKPATTAVKSDRYKGAGPSAEATAGEQVQEVGMFSGTPENQLFQYVNGPRWYFYNDGRAVEMKVAYVFGPQSDIRPLGTTVFEKVDDGFKCDLVIYPGETVPFIEGKPNGFSCTFSTAPLSQAYMDRVLAENVAAVQEQIEAVQALAGDASDDVEEVLRRCVQSGTPFVDLQFKPKTSSNYRSGIDSAIADTQWLRPNQYLTPDQLTRLAVFNVVEPNDIDQGSLGDCYFLCALASLAEFPSKVEDVFSHPVGASEEAAERRVGAYRVTLNKGGWWVIHIVDNFFPCLGDAPRYARNREDPAELWVMLLEKAHAKSHGSYSAIAGGDALQALQDLTGYPYMRITDGLATWFDAVLRWDDEKAMITVSTPGQDTSNYAGGGGANDPALQAKYDKAGLALGHAYSVLRAVRVGDTRLVQIRNPWGNDVEWTGAWGDKDDRWTQQPAIAAACDFNGGEADGTFWMAWDDVAEYFKTGGVCFTKFDWFDYRILGHCSEGFPNFALEVRVAKKTEMFLSIHQRDRRGVVAGDPDDTYASFMIAVARNKNGRQAVHLHSAAMCESPCENPNFVTGRDVSMRYTFEPEHNPYVIVPRIHEKVEKDFVLSLIAEHGIADGLEVRFKDLGRTCKVYDNYLGFDYKPETLSAVTTTYQFNPEQGTPITRSGDCISI